VEITYLGREHVIELGMTMADVLDVVENAFRAKGLGEAEMPPKPGVHPRPDCFLHAMPAYVRGADVAGLKWVSGYPTNPARGLPYVGGLLVLNDAETGLPVAIMEAGWITAMRTGASVGVAAKYLARRESSVVAIVGCGVQNRASLAALVEILPQLSEVRCYDVRDEAVNRFVAEMRAAYPQLTFVTCSRAAEAVRLADVAVTAVPIVVHPHPELDAGVLPVGALAVALDYDAAWSAAAVDACDKLCCDDVEQFLATRARGEHFTNLSKPPSADLSDVIVGRQPGREGPSERIFAVNMGIAVEDILTAQVLYDRAHAAGIGVKLGL